MLLSRNPVTLNRVIKQKLHHQALQRFGLKDPKGLITQPSQATDQAQ